jgi:tetratricopeptide (TPR) repeat protein
VVLFSFRSAIAGLAATTLFGLTLWGQAAQQNWKDRGEYDLVQSITKEQNPQTKLGLIQSWQEKYPTSDFKDDRSQALIQTYQQLGKAKEMLETAKQWVATNPKAFPGWYWICALTVSMQDTSGPALDQGSNAAKALLGLVDDTFSPARKAAQVTDEQWKQQRGGAEAVAYRTLGWVALQKKEYEEADKNLIESLKRNPADAQASHWAATANLRTKKLERQGLALFHFCRASQVEGPGAFPQATRDKLRESFEKNYINFHGNKDGIEEVIAKAKVSAIPEGIVIESQDEILAKQEEALKKTNPMLALWISIKKELTSANSAAYFDGSLKNSQIPGGVEVGTTKVEKFKGKVVSCDVAAPKKPKKIVLGISSAEVSEVTLAFENALSTVCPDPGTELEFSGVPTAFTAEPFNLTFDVEPAGVSGLPTPPKGVAKKAVAPAAKKAVAPAAKKAVAPAAKKAAAPAAKK